MRTKLAKGRPSLTHTLDKEIYQVVGKLYDEYEGRDPGSSFGLSIPFIYEKIKRSNSSLNRKPKRLLEESIERVIEVFKEEQGSSEEPGSMDGEFNGTELSPPHISDAMNRSLVGMWTRPSGQNGGSRDHPQDIIQETRIEHTRVKKRSSHGEPPATKRKKVTTSVDRSPSSPYTFTDFGGVGSVIVALTNSIGQPLLCPSLYTAFRITPPRGVLLYGPPGCGKTMIANTFAARLGVPFISLSAPSIVSGMSGESEKALREHFEEAKRLAPSLIFLDEIDAIGQKRENAQREMEKRIVAQLLTCMDDIALEKTGGKPVMVIAATNRPDDLDPALRRGGRFDKEISMPMPTEAGREQILRAVTRNLNLSDDVDFKALARMTPGFVGADLRDLATTAGTAAMERFVQSLAPKGNEMEMDEGLNALMEVNYAENKMKLLENLLVKDSVVSITHKDFTSSIPEIQPMAKREGFTAVPETTWEDVGALHAVKDELRTDIVQRILRPEKSIRLGFTESTAALLWGPPGCGKTLIAQAIANEVNTRFIAVKGPELLNKYVGESERAIRQVFEKARAVAPCMIFFDELDALAPNRGHMTSESSARVVSTLLTELNGPGRGQGIHVLGATNHPRQIDEALLRSGRLDRQFFIGLPSKDERVDILRALTRKSNVVFDEVIANIARECDGFSGADLAHLVNRARSLALRRDGDSLEAADFVGAVKKVKQMQWGHSRGNVLPNLGDLTTQSASSV